MDEEEKTPAEPELDRQRLFETRAKAMSFRARGEAVYPGKLLVLRSGSFAMHPVDDNAYDTSRERVQGIAIWGARKKWQPGMVRVEEGPEGKSAPLIGGDDQRPSSGVPLIDAWIARADALRCVRRGYFRAFGPLPLTPLELQASVEEVTKIVREKAKDLLKIAPRDQRDLLLSLAKVVDQPTPNDQALTEAIRELLAASAVWIPLSRKGVIETEWKEVQTRLLAMRKKGKPYTSMADLARRCECGSSTVHKAIHASAELEGWMARHTKATVLPHATSLSDIVTENTPQESENEPSDVLIKHDIDIEMRRLIEQASPEEKARMNTMNEEERCELVKTFNEQYRDREPSPLRGDPPDKRPTKVISSKRL